MTICNKGYLFPYWTARWEVLEPEVCLLSLSCCCCCCCCSCSSSPTTLHIWCFPRSWHSLPVEGISLLLPSSGEEAAYLWALFQHHRQRLAEKARKPKTDEPTRKHCSPLIGDTHQSAITDILDKDRWRLTHRPHFKLSISNYTLENSMFLDRTYKSCSI